MTATTLASEEVIGYMAAVRAALDDLPPAERDDLVAEVEASLMDAEAEGGPVRDRLGPPERFAAELRAAAGLSAASASPAARESLLGRAQAALAEFAERPRVAAARRMGEELAPIWWVVRAYALVIAVAHLEQAGWSQRLPIIPRPGQTYLLLIAAAVAASVALGLRARKAGPRRPSGLRLAGNAALVLATLVAAAHALDVARGGHAYGAQQPEIIYEHAEQSAFPGLILDNIYPYDRRGRLLHDVRLYDSAGRPLDIAAGDPSRRLLFDRAGQPVLNSFPIRYFEPDTRRVADPEAGPEVNAERIVTPPLERE